MAKASSSLHRNRPDGSISPRSLVRVLEWPITATLPPTRYWDGMLSMAPRMSSSEPRSVVVFLMVSEPPSMFVMPMSELFRMPATSPFAPVPRRNCLSSRMARFREPSSPTRARTSNMESDTKSSFIQPMTRDLRIGAWTVWNLRSCSPAVAAGVSETMLPTNVPVKMDLSLPDARWTVTHSTRFEDVGVTAQSWRITEKMPRLRIIWSCRSGGTVYPPSSSVMVSMTYCSAFSMPALSRNGASGRSVFWPMLFFR